MLPCPTVFVVDSAPRGAFNSEEVALGGLDEEVNAPVASKTGGVRIEPECGRMTVGTGGVPLAPAEEDLCGWPEEVEVEAPEEEATLAGSKDIGGGALESAFTLPRLGSAEAVGLAATGGATGGAGGSGRMVKSCSSFVDLRCRLTALRMRTPTYGRRQ